MKSNNKNEKLRLLRWGINPNYKKNQINTANTKNILKLSSGENFSSFSRFSSKKLLSQTFPFNNKVKPSELLEKFWR